MQWLGRAPVPKLQNSDNCSKSFLYPVLPPFKVRKAENNLQKPENDRNSIVKKQKKSRKYIY